VVLGYRVETFVIRTRFAPSPTGPLHLGHAYSAITAHDFARVQGGEFLLRIEDIDQSRARPVWEAQILDDLHWLGLTWHGPVLRQSERLTTYSEAIEILNAAGLLYCCTCTRRDIAQAVSAPQEGVLTNSCPDSTVYPGTCRSSDETIKRIEGAPLRLNMALALNGRSSVSFMELISLQSLPKVNINNVKYIIDKIGDIVILRKNEEAAYHLAVVVDDAAQDITHVVRGDDLKLATPIHAVLQQLLGLPTPTYMHHPLIRDETGKRLAKRDDAKAISKFRAEGATPAGIRAMIGL
tara:strand:+ start:74 stop:958 length:885 start_codon:yes stop_codon:yes gene_type:complete